NGVNAGNGPTMTMGGNGGTSTMNLNSGTMTVYGNLNMSINGAGASSTINIGPGATLNINTNPFNPSVNPGNILIGSFTPPPATFNLNGGNLSLNDFSGVPNPSGTVTFQNNNNNNFGIYTTNLNSGVFTVGSFTVNLTADSSAGNFNLNNV